jgi:hypothetical protein
VTFRRLLRADAIAMVAAFLLLFVMALDWYSTPSGQEARRVEKTTQPPAGAAGEDLRAVKDDASQVAEGQERNAWQPFGLLDSVILIGLLMTFVLAIGAGYLRAAGKRFEPPYTPSSATAVAAGVTGLLVAFRSIQEPGIDSASVVEAGVPLALAVLGAIAWAAAGAYRAEERGEAFKELPEPVPSGESPAG